jgi:hypothetical protein
VSAASLQREAVVAQAPHVATLGNGGRTCGFQGGIEVEGVEPLPFLAAVDALEKLPQLILSEPARGQVDGGDVLEVQEEAGE